MRAIVGFSFLPFFNSKMVYFYPPILPIMYTQVWLQLISNLMCLKPQLKEMVTLDFPTVLRSI